MPAPVITPNTVSELRSDQTQQFSADQSVTWSASAGNISAGGLFTPERKTDSVTVTATNGSNQSTNLTVPVIAVFDWDLDFTIGEKFRKESRIFIPRSGPKDRQTRIDIDTIQTLEVKGSWYQSSDRDSILQFYRDHHPHKDFYFYDKHKSEMWRAWIPGEMTRQRRRSSGDYGFSIERLDWNSILIDNEPPTIPQNLQLVSGNLSWQASTDNVAVTGYELEIVYPN